MRNNYDGVDKTVEENLQAEIDYHFPESKWEKRFFIASIIIILIGLLVVIFTPQIIHHFTGVYE